MDTKTCYDHPTQFNETEDPPAELVTQEYPLGPGDYTNYPVGMMLKLFSAQGNLVSRSNKIWNKVEDPRNKVEDPILVLRPKVIRSQILVI